jgi:hypothetical protein
MATNLKSSTKLVGISTNNGTTVQVQLSKSVNGVRSVKIEVEGLDFINALAHFENKIDKDKTSEQTFAGQYIDCIDDCIQLLTNLRKFVEDETKISS